LKFSWQNDINIFENYSTLVGFETENETFSHESFYGSAWGVSGDTVNDISNRTTGIYMHNIYAPTQSIHLTGGIRFDSHEQFSNETTYRFTAVKNYKAFGLKLSGMIGTGFKAPTLFNLYHPSYGNDALEPEKSFGWEIGFEKSFGSFATVSGTYFDTEFDNLIGYDPVTFRNININKANTNGIEISILLNPVKDLYTEFSYVYTNAIDESDDSRLLRRPPHKGTINLRYRPIPKTQTYLSVRIVGDRNDLAFIDFSSRRVLLDTYTVVDLAVSYTVSDMLTLKGRVENLSDKEYEEIVGYYSPRRSLYGGVEIRL
jgi:vitamin B12 transporter